MSFTEREGDIQPDYSDDENGNAPHFPGYERVIPHESVLDSVPAVTEPLDDAVMSAKAIVIEIERKLDGGQSITQDEASMLNSHARGTRPLFPSKTVEDPGEGHNHTW